MGSGARTPEELETLFEDAFVIRDRQALRLLFEDTAVLATGSGWHEARGPDQIAHLVSAMWERERSYVADLRRILQARDTALVVSAQQMAVVRRGADRAWRYAISFLSTDSTSAKEE